MRALRKGQASATIPLKYTQPSGRTPSRGEVWIRKGWITLYKENSLVTPERGRHYLHPLDGVSIVRNMWVFHNDTSA